MLSRPVRFAGLVIVLGLAAGGCSAKTSAAAPATSAAAVTPSASPSDSRTPLQILTASIPTEKSPIYHYSITSTDDTESGVIDPPGKIAEFLTTTHFTKPTYTMDDTTLLTKDKSWEKVKMIPAHVSGLEPMPTKWMSLDPQKIKLKNGTPFVYVAESDPGYTNEVFENATDVNRVSPGHFSGTTDLSGTNPDDLLSADQLNAMGAKATTVAFTAVVDGQGRLSTVSLQYPAAGKFKAGTYVITYDQYGTAAVPKLPTAAETIKAPSYVYDWYK